MDKNKSNNSNNKEKLKTILFIVLSIVLIAAIIACIVFIYNNNKKEEEKELPYTELIKEITNKNVAKVEMTAGMTTAKITLKGMAEGEEKNTLIPNTQVFMELIQTQALEGNEIELIQKPRSILSLMPSYIMTMLPTFIMIIAK